MTTPIYLVPLPDGQWLALDAATFAQALAAGAQVVPGHATELPRTSESSPLLTAEQIAAQTGMDPSWFLTRARTNDIPHVKFGKYVRFDLTAVTTHLAREVKR